MRWVMHLAACSALLAPTVSRAQGIPVDEVLGAIADVVQSRAERVASHAIQRELGARICKDEDDVLSHPLVAKYGTKSLSLYLGGRKDCRADDEKCKADDIFVRSCTLLREDSTLTDVYFLKSLSRETVDLVVRLAGGTLEEAEFESAGLAHLSEYIHRVMEELAEDGANLGDLADPTIRLAEQISTDLPFSVLQELGDSAEAKALHIGVDAWLTKACAGKTTPECVAWTGPEGRANWSVLTATGQLAPDGCSTYVGPARYEARQDLFQKLFKTDSKPYAGAEERACIDLFSANADTLAGCQRARVLINLNDHLNKLPCNAITDRHKSLRQLGYALAQRRVFLDALPAAEDELYEKYFARAGLLQLDDLPREVVAIGVRMIGTYLRARDEEPESTNLWLDQLRADIKTSEADFERLLDLPALDSHTAPKAAGVRALRDSIKDLLTLPALHVRRRQDLVDSAKTAQTEARRLLIELVRPRSAKPSAKDAVVLIADLLGSVDRLSESLDRTLADEGVRQAMVLASLDVLKATGGGTLSTAAQTGMQARAEASVRAAQVRIKNLSVALETVVRLVRIAADRDWVGLAVEASSQFRTQKVEGDLGRSVGFLRVLMATYQAPTREEAKRIFEGALEEEASREKRFGAATVDIAALLSVRAGWQFDQTRTETGVAGVTETTRDNGALGGLFAPFGAQFAYKRVGVLFYPLDLGAYLVDADTEGAEESAPIWRSAIRAGGVVYGFRGHQTPVMVGIGADYHPAFDDSEEVRVFATVGLELPLFILH